VVSKARQPLYQMKADFFKTLGHPARIRILELLSERDHTVSEMLPEVGIEPANLSQQLSILRRAGLVTARREGLSVSYTPRRPARPDGRGDRLIRANGGQIPHAYYLRNF
jgi:DNA-binding transcriptional ArsR family regulator